MTRKTKIVISFLGVLILILLSFRIGFFRNSQNDFIQILNKVLVGDKMKMNTSKEIDENKIKVTLAFSNKTVFEHTQFLDNIGEVYGGPIFDIYYNDLLIGRAFHDNTNNWYTNEFVFDFYKEKEKIKFKFKTNGRDKKGEEGYIYIEQSNDSLNFESYNQDGKLINKWKE